MWLVEERCVINFGLYTFVGKSYSLSRDLLDQHENCKMATVRLVSDYKTDQLELSEQLSSLVSCFLHLCDVNM